MTTTNAKLRSLFLTVVVVCSVVAAAGPLAGTAGATRVAGNSELLTDGPNWYGQDFLVDVTQNGPGEFTAGSGDTVYLLEVDQRSNTVNRTARVLTVNGTGYVSLETGNLVTDGRQAYALNDDNELNGGAVNFTLEPQTLDLEWEEESIADDRESIALETVETNRGAGDYNVTIRADGFEYEQLRALFVHPGTDLREVTARDHLPLERFGFDPDDGDGVEELRSDGYITLNLSASTAYRQDGEIVANFSNLAANETVPDDGEYEFDIVVTDSTAEDTATVEIGGAGADFEEPLYTRPAGDIATFTVDLDSTEQTWVQLRDTESNFVDVLYLEDDDGDGEVTFYANTRLMGTDHAQLSGISAGDSEVVYDSEDDTVQSYIHHEVVPSGSGTDVGDAQFYDGETVNSSAAVSFSQYVQTLNGNTPTTQLDRPLQPTTYELVVDRSGRFTIEDGEATVDRQLGETELDLVQPTLREFDTWVAPESTVDRQRSVNRLEANLTSRSDIAIGDRMVLRANTTGIVGALAAIDYAENGNSIDTGLTEGYDVDVFYELAVNEDGTDWEGEGVNLTIRGEDQANAAADRLPLDDGDGEDAYVLVNQQTAEGDPGNVYAVVDTGADAYEDSITDGQEYDATLSYVATGGRFAFSADGPQGGTGGDVTDPIFPYYAGGFTENATERTPMAFESPELTFDSVEAETVTLAPSQNATVSGETNLAPGTPLTVTVRLAPPSDTVPDEDPSFLARQSTEVDADGTFDATFDLSERTVGEAATVRVSRADTTVTTSDAEFVDIGAVQGPYFETAVTAPANARANETVNVTGTVTNTGERSGTADVTLVVDGTDAVRGIFDLEPGESRELTHSLTMGADDVEVVIESQDTSQSTTVRYAGPETVEETTTRTRTATPTATSTPAQAVEEPQQTPQPDGGGGFPWLLGSVGAGVGLAGAAVLVIRWFS